VAPGGYFCSVQLDGNSGSWWIFLLSSIFRFRIAVSRLVLQHRITAQYCSKKIFCPANRAKRAGTNKWSGRLDSPQKNKDSNFSIYKQKIKKFMNAKLSRITLYTNFETHVLI
jgi:hypothetical protein